MDLCSKVELFHTLESEPYVTMFVKDHWETWPLRSSSFRHWLQREYYNKFASPPSAQAVQDALAILESKARFDGQAKEVYVRVGKHDGNIYIDLANDQWQIVEIFANGWKLLNESPIKFRRTNGMKALPVPVLFKPDLGLQKLRTFLNLESDLDFKLLVIYLLGAFDPDGPYLVLVLYGEQGSSKSTTVRVLRDLIDPNITPLRREPRNSDDLLVGARSNWLIAIDNLSYLQDWLSDDLCRLATGGGMSKRQNYSDVEEVVVNAKRPILLNGIDEFIARNDLANRSVIINLPRIPERKTPTGRGVLARF